MKHLTVKEKEVQAFEKMKNSTGALSSEFHYKNAMAAPKMVKIVLNVGTGTAIKKDKNKKEGTAFFELLGIPFKKEEKKKK